ARDVGALVPVHPPHPGLPRWEHRHLWCRAVRSECAGAARHEVIEARRRRRRRLERGDLLLAAERAARREVQRALREPAECFAEEREEAGIAAVVITAVVVTAVVVALVVGQKPLLECGKSSCRRGCLDASGSPFVSPGASWADFCSRFKSRAYSERNLSNHFAHSYSISCWNACPLRTSRVRSSRRWSSSRLVISPKNI